MIRRGGWGTVTVLGALLGGLGFSSESRALTQCFAPELCCLDDRNDAGAVCTSNDVTFVLVGLGTQSDGCVSTSDTVEILLGASVRNTTAQERYDIGMWIGTGQESALTGQCAREMLTPAYPTTWTDNGGAEDCQSTDGGFLDLLGATTGPNAEPDDNGYYLTAEVGGNNSLVDACGDLADGGQTGCDTDGDGEWDDSFMVYQTAVILPCDDDDSDGDGTTGSDGFVNIPTCASWGNQANEVYDGTDDTCDSVDELENGTPAKCRCEDSNSSIPVPALSLSCSCSPATLRNDKDRSTACTVTYSNADIANCTPDTGTTERFRCGTASFLRFVADAPEAVGTLIDNQPTTPFDSPTVGTIVVSPSGVGNGAPETLTWNPRNQIGGGSLNIIGEAQSESMTFQFVVNAGTAPGSYSIPVSTVWSNTANFAVTSTQALNTSCSFTVSDSATWVSISRFEAFEEDGETVLEWETSAEIGTLGFEIRRREGNRWVPVLERTLPALQRTPGGTYRAIDTAAHAGERQTYQIIEVDQAGRRQTLGPYSTIVGRRERPRSARALTESAVDAMFQATPKEPSARMVAAHRAAERQSARNARLAAEAVVQASSAKIAIETSGLYRVTATQISAALGEPIGKVRADLQQGRFRLTNGGQPAAWQLDGDGFLFWGEAIDSPYTRQNVYWLDGGTATALATVPANYLGVYAADWNKSFETVTHSESDVFGSTFAALGPRDDFYFWRVQWSEDPGLALASYQAQAEAPADAGNATVALNVHAFEPVRVALSVNGVAVGEAEAGMGRVRLEVPIDAGLLHAGNNLVEVQALAGVFFTDSIDLTYRRFYKASGGALLFRGEGNGVVSASGFPSSDIALYDVSQALRPRRVSGFAAVLAPDGTWGFSFAPAGPTNRYLAAVPQAWGAVTSIKGDRPSNLRNKQNAGAYVVLTSPDLAAAGARLADLRRGQGLSAQVVTVEDVMDEYAFGIFDPEAMRLFVADAITNWQDPPRYLVLGGKGSYDFKNVSGFGSGAVPPWMVITDQGLIASDGALADFDGDGVGEIAVGRIPVVNAAEMSGYIDKLIAYEADPAGDWGTRVAVVADNADSGGNFPASADLLAGSVSAGKTVDRIELPGAADATQIAGTRAALAQAFRDGRGAIHYVGHGGVDRLANEGILTSVDVPSLGNGARAPIFSALTCNIGLFSYPGFSSVGEDLVAEPTGGSVSVFAPAGLSFNGEATQLGQGVASALSTGGGRLGERMQRALRAFVLAGGARDAARAYSLLGDPALQVKQ